MEGSLVSNCAIMSALELLLIMSVRLNTIDIKVLGF